MADNKDIVSSIFGMTPELYQQAQLQRDIEAQTKAATMAAQPGTMLNPSLAPLYAQAAQQGQILGKGAKAVGGLLGVEDPELKMIRDIQEMRSQFDVSTPAGLRKFSQALSARGYTKFAMEAAKEADNREKVVKETQYIGREIKEIGVKGNPELVQKAAVDKDGNVIRTIGEPYSRFTAKTLVNAGQKHVLSLDEKQAEQYLQTFNSTAQALPTLDRMKALVDSGVISGNMSEWRQGTAGVLNGLGINTSSLNDKLANSEEYNKEVANLLKDTLKAYGNNPSNLDLKAGGKTLPELARSPQGLQQILTALIEKKRKEYKEAKRGLEHYRNNEGSFRNYEPEVPIGLVDKPAGKTITINKPLNQYSTQELQQLLDQNK